MNSESGSDSLGQAVLTIKTNQDGKVTTLRQEWSTNDANEAAKLRDLQDAMRAAGAPTDVINATSPQRVRP